MDLSYLNLDYRLIKQRTFSSPPRKGGASFFGGRVGSCSFYNPRKEVRLMGFVAVMIETAKAKAKAKAKADKAKAKGKDKGNGNRFCPP